MFRALFGFVFSPAHMTAVAMRWNHIWGKYKMKRRMTPSEAMLKEIDQLAADYPNYNFVINWSTFLAGDRHRTLYPTYAKGVRI